MVMFYECPRCKNEEHTNGAKFCKICGLKLNGEFKENELGDTYFQTELEGEHLTDKKANVEYWDNLDGLAQETLEEMAKAAGIYISDWGDLDDIKKVVDTLKEIIEERFKVKFPFVDEDY
jgi:hypothetical protein